MWNERQRLEAELSARGEEIDRLKASENTARATTAILEGRVENLSKALREEQARARREAEAGAEAKTKNAMSALRLQLDDLRREVERARLQQTARVATLRGAGMGRGVTVSNGAGSEAKPKRECERAVAEGGKIRAGDALSSTVLEGEFQRLRAKYEKAKGRIAALEELMAASRRASAQAHAEFQVRGHSLLAWAQLPHCVFAPIIVFGAVANVVKVGTICYTTRFWGTVTPGLLGIALVVVTKRLDRRTFLRMFLSILPLTRVRSMRSSCPKSCFSKSTVSSKRMRATLWTAPLSHPMRAWPLRYL